MNGHNRVSRLFEYGMSLFALALFTLLPLSFASAQLPPTTEDNNASKLLGNVFGDSLRAKTKQSPTLTPAGNGAPDAELTISTSTSPFHNPDEVIEVSPGQELIEVHYEGDCLAAP